PGGRQPADHLVDFTPLDAALEQQLALAIVFLEHRLAGLKHEHEPAVWIDERNAAVEREVQLAILLVTGAAQVADGAVRYPAQRVLGDQAAGLRLRHENRRAGVLQRADAVEHEVLEGDPRPQTPRQQEAADAEAGGREDLDALAPV